MWHVYLLRCGDGSLYTGIARDADKRAAVHNSGRGAKYTRSRLPVSVVYREVWPDRSAALRRESALKRLSHAEKEALAQGMPPAAPADAAKGETLGKDQRDAQP